MKAFVCRLGPRVTVRGQARGTVIDPLSPDSPDQSAYFDANIMTGRLPKEIHLEFGQPPKRRSVLLISPNDVVVLILGAIDFRGSANERGVIGLGRVQSVEYSGEGPSQRCKMVVDRVTDFDPIINPKVLERQEWFESSKLRAVRAFGFDGKVPAQNILKCFGDEWSPDQMSAQVRAILGTLQGSDPGLLIRLQSIDAELASLIPEINPDWVPPRPQSVNARAAATTLPPAASTNDLAERLYIPVESVDEMLWILEKKQSLILSGPPGVGKTHIARELAHFMFGANTDFVQFHPSYSYEYFVSGIRPSMNVATLNYELAAGPLLDILHQADADERDVPYGLIIDEINRANVSSVFGELLTAMEYRGLPVRLQYGSPYDDRGEFVVPENFYIIATMNRADRSAGNFDSALRRRFGVFDCYPTEEPFKSALRRFIDTHHNDKQWLVDWVSDINDLVPDPDFSIGASFFMNSDLSDDEVVRIMKFEIGPYLYGKFGKTAPFGSLLTLGPTAVREKYISALGSRPGNLTLNDATNT